MTSNIRTKTTFKVLYTFNTNALRIPDAKWFFLPMLAWICEKCSRNMWIMSYVHLHFSIDHYQIEEERKNNHPMFFQREYCILNTNNSLINKSIPNGKLNIVRSILQEHVKFPQNILSYITVAVFTFTRFCLRTFCQFKHFY